MDNNQSPFPDVKENIVTPEPSYWRDNELELI